MTLDVSMRAVALRLIDSKGKTISYLRETDGAYDVATGTATQTATTYSVKAVLRDKDGKSFGDSDTLRGFKSVMVASSALPIAPVPGDKVTFDSSTFVVLKVDSTYSGELTAVHDLLCGAV